MEQGRVSTGSEAFDTLLDGGFESDTVTTVYGPSGSGKTNLCIIAAVSVLKSGRKVVYIDSEGGLSVERLKQIAPDSYKELLDRMIILKPMNFSEQRNAFGQLSKLVDEDVGLVVVDTISMLYRLEIGQTDDVYSVNKDLGMQISYLNELTRRNDIPVVVTNQVYASFETPQSVKMVGGDILKYGSKCLVELQKARKGIRRAVLKKHRSIAEDREIVFRIVDAGLEKVEDR
ncbi:DNA repair and recombination protein RadB [Candidatus Woesearchaeota archaeon]|nr:DNA repair and recombination protein RadB [Candidatus Woesearchaeota archaeon]